MVHSTQNSNSNTSFNDPNVAGNTQWNPIKTTSKIVKVRKNTSGDITDVMMANGNVFSIDEAIVMAKDNLIEGVNVGRAKNGREYLRGNPNGVESDNLDQLPQF